MITPHIKRASSCLYGSMLILCLLFCGCLQTPSTGPKNEAMLRSPDADFQAQGVDRPPSARTLYAMAEILSSQGKDSECEFVLRQCVRQYPSFSPAYNSLAELQMRQGRVHQAVDVLLKALAVRPQDPVLLNNLGMCYLVQKHCDKALDCFTRAAGTVPESEKYRANMATALGLLGRHEEAFALLCQILPEEQARNNAAVLHQAFDKIMALQKTSG
jgi:Flp pilus assembly protein TadD